MYNMRTSGSMKINPEIFRALKGLIYYGKNINFNFFID